MVSHHDLRAAGVDHRLDQLERLELFCAAVDEIADEHRGTFRVAVDPRSVLLVPEFAQQRLELCRAAVNVTDDVVLDHFFTPHLFFPLHLLEPTGIEYYSRPTIFIRRRKWSAAMPRRTG